MRSCLGAQGKALALLVAVLQSKGIVSADEFGDLLGIFAAITAEADEREGDILALWASIVKDSGLGREEESG